MDRQTKFPKDRKLRKRLIRFLASEGYSTLYITILLGYSASSMLEIESLRINSLLDGLYKSSDTYRKTIVDEHVKRMEDKKIFSRKKTPPKC